MSPVLIAQLIQYMALVPGAISVVKGTIAEVQKLREGGKAPTDAQLKALVDKMQAAHEALPKPE